MRWRKVPLDPAVKQQLELHPKEKVLAWADDGSGRPVVATESALHLQRTPPHYTRFGWEQIERASYDTGVLSVVLTPDAGSVVLRVPVGDARELPVVVRDRVTASVMVDRFVPLRDEAGVRIVARRTTDGAVIWRTDLDPVLVGDSRVQSDAEAALADVRAEVGDA